MRTYETPTRFAAPLLFLLGILSIVLGICSKTDLFGTICLAGLLFFLANRIARTRRKHKELDQMISKN